MPLDSSILERNLAALSRQFPSLAEPLTACQAHLPNLAPAPTRDGRLNLRTQDADGTEHWFGRTSIPFIRASALLSTFDPGSANVLLPGIAEGTEAKLLLEGIGPHRAVFVWEQDAVNLLLAFRLHDFAGDLQSGRLVPILADFPNLATALIETLEKLPGHFCPDRLLMWPWQTPAEIAPCRSAVEAAYHEIERRRQTKLAGLQKKLAAPPPETRLDGSPSALLFSIHPNEDLWALSDRITAAARDEGWQMQPVTIRSPADVHPLARAARLSAALTHAPEIALLLDVCRAEVADVLPPAVPAIAWLSRRSAIDENLPSRLGPTDQVIATDQRLAERLIDLGIERTRVSVRAQPALLACDTPPGWEERPVDVALVANLAPINPQSYGIDLPTHLAIWQAALDLLRASLDSFTDSEIAPLLARAEAKARARIEEPVLRNRIAEILAGPVATTMTLQDLAHALSQAGLKIAVHGNGWGELPGLTVNTGTPGPAERLKIYRRAKTALFASTIGTVWPDVLLAASAGSAVAWRSHPNDTAPGGFATLLKPGTEAIVFDRTRAATAHCKRLLGSRERWQELVAAAYERCQTDHSPAAALACLRTTARGVFPMKRT